MMSSALYAPAGPAGGTSIGATSLGINARHPPTLAAAGPLGPFDAGQIVAIAYIIYYIEKDGTT